MGTIIDFPAEAASRRSSLATDAARSEFTGTVLILPVVRIEREVDESNGSGPEEGAATGRRRRRRARS